MRYSLSILNNLNYQTLTKEFERRRCNGYFIVASPDYDNSTMVNLVKLYSSTRSNQSYIVMKSMGQADLGTEIQVIRLTVHVFRFIETHLLV